MRRVLPILLLAVSSCVSSPADERHLYNLNAPADTSGPVLASAHEWPMAGRSPDRNAVSGEMGLPVEFGGPEGKNIVWSAELGDDTYGTPVIAGGRVFIGTNRRFRRGPAEINQGVLLCFWQRDGQPLWEAVQEKPRFPMDLCFRMGVASTPCVVGNRLYYVSGRGELVCSTTEGRPGTRDVENLWMLDLRKDLGVRLYETPLSSPLVWRSLVFILTGHGADWTVEPPRVDNPRAPSFIAVDRLTGKVVWQDASPGDRLRRSSRGSPALGVVDGVPQVAFPGGDGWLYAFEPATGKLLWKFNCKAHEKRESDLVPLTPVYVGHRVLVAIGGDLIPSSEAGCLRAIDARGRGDVTRTHEVWRMAGAETGEFGSTLSSVAVQDGLVYVAEQWGFLDCVELETGERVWRHDLLATLGGSPVVADGKVYLQTDDGEVLVYQAGRTLKLLARNVLSRAGTGTIAVANGRLYVNGWTRLCAIEETRK